MLTAPCLTTETPPNSTISLTILWSNLKFLGIICSSLLEDKKKYKIYKPQLAKDKEVAKPAPHIPQLNTLINKISNKIFSTAGIIIAYIANFGFPSALIVGFPIIAKAKKGTP